MHAASSVQVTHFRQVLLWPLRLIPSPDGAAKPYRPWQLLQQGGEGAHWREVIDEYTGAADQFHERHYNEFVTFLPFVQQFLYGEGRDARGRDGKTSESPMRVFRRQDVRRARMTLRPGDAPIELDIVHVDLYFFSTLIWCCSTSRSAATISRWRRPRS